MNQTICSFAGCEKKKRARGLCDGHYQQIRQGRELKTLGLRPKTRNLTDLERFNHYADKSGGCWVWTGTVYPDGYGRMLAGGKNRAAHRVSYQMHVGPISDGMQIDHMCHNRSCVNPDHLRQATPKQNSENIKGARPGSRSRHRGVSWYSKTGKWRAQIGHNYNIVHLGYFDSEEEAARVVLEGRLELFTHSDGR